MRINVYSEEMTQDAIMIRKDDVIGEDGTPVTFYGLRIYLKGSPDLHSTDFDDDRPAITFWHRDREQLCSMFRFMVYRACGR